MLTFLFLNQTLWCYHSLESSRRDDFNEGHIIGFGWEIRKLSWKLFCSLFLNCSPGKVYIKVAIQRKREKKWFMNNLALSKLRNYCGSFNLSYSATDILTCWWEFSKYHYKFSITIWPASQENGPSDTTNSVDQDQPLHNVENS